MEKLGLRLREGPMPQTQAAAPSPAEQILLCWAMLRCWSQPSEAVLKGSMFSLSAVPTGAPVLMLLFGLLDSAAEGSIQSTQMKLKRARLADDLNEKIALRPGPLELVEKNIIPVDSAVKEAIKGSDSKRVCCVCAQGARAAKGTRRYHGDCRK